VAQIQGCPLELRNAFLRSRKDASTLVRAFEGTPCFVETSRSSACCRPRLGLRTLVRCWRSAPISRTYQIRYRNAASFCTSAPFNLTNGVEILWSP